MKQYDTLTNFLAGNLKQAILRVVECFQQNNNPAARAFLDELLEKIPDADHPDNLFIDVAENHICHGETASVSSDLVRVVDGRNFLRYYSMKFIMLEGAAEQQGIQNTLNSIKTMQITAENLAFIFNQILELNGRLRRRGRPLWLTDVDSVNNCANSQDYINRLALGDAQPPLFRFTIPKDQIQKCPNVRPDQSEFDPGDLMEIHIPTFIDGMYYDTFLERGKTAGGASEYTSKLDNTEAIKEMEVV